MNGLQTLLPAIRARREEIERARRLPQDLVDDLTATGIFRLGVPKALGGDEAEPADMMRAIETVATADGSAGWCAMIAISNGPVAGYMSEQGAKEVYADPSAPTAGLAAPTGDAVPADGGVRLSGRWRFASGIAHADWVFAGAVVLQNGSPRMTESGTPQIVHAFLPVTDIEVIDTWHVTGLCGTGSNDVVAADVFVPEHRLFSLFDPSEHRPEPLYRMPPVALFATQVAAVALGIARAALDELAVLSESKTPSFSTVRLSEKPVTQIQLARAEAALGGARSFLYDTVEEMWQTVQAGREPSPRLRAMCRIAAVQASETSAAVARQAETLAGGSSIYLDSPLQRHARDAGAALHHVTQSPQTWEEAGRILAGLEPTFPIF